nr:hypothetical protein [Enterobacter roggenkampii]
MSNVAYANFAAHSAVRSNRMENQKPIHPVVPECSEANPVEGRLLRTLWKNLLLFCRPPAFTQQTSRRQWPLQNRTTGHHLSRSG